MDISAKGEIVSTATLFLYTSQEILTTKPHIANFVNFYLRSVNDYIGDVSYFAVPKADFGEMVQAFEAMGN